MTITYDDEGVAVKIRQRKGLDLHVHFREGDMMRLVLPMTVRQFAGAVFMPNLEKPITTYDRLCWYRDSAVRVISEWKQNESWKFTFIMTFYLTDTLDPDELLKAEKPVVKYYPPGLTTNSDNGVKDPASLWTPGTRPYEALCTLADQDGTLLLHAANGLDVNGEELDPYDQEIDFVKNSLPLIRKAHPNLRIVFEHLSTAEGAAYMRANGGPKLGCTITAQHLLLDRRDTHRKGLHVHKHWWPIIQGKRHRDAIRELGGLGLPFVFLGTDSAPHPIVKKEAECCVGGVLTAHCAMELYAEVFEDMGKLELLENFSSVYGPQFYGLPLSDEEITLEKVEWTVPKEYRISKEYGQPYTQSHLHPFRAGEKMRWKLAA